MKNLLFLLLVFLSVNCLGQKMDSAKLITSDNPITVSGGYYQLGGSLIMNTTIDTSKWKDASKAKRGQLEWTWSSDYVRDATQKAKTDSVWHRIFEVYDSTMGIVAYQENDNPMVVLDSAATIRVLIKSMEGSWKQNALWQKKFFAASEILDYIKTDGTITNKKKFNLAVKKYQKLMKPNP